MTLSLLIYALMITTLVSLAGVLVVDTVRGLSRSPAPKAARSIDRSASRSARNYGAAATRS